MEVRMQKEEERGPEKGKGQFRRRLRVKKVKASAPLESQGTNSSQRKQATSEAKEETQHFCSKPDSLFPDYT